MTPFFMAWHFSLCLDIKCISTTIQKIAILDSSDTDHPVHWHRFVHVNASLELGCLHIGIFFQSVLQAKLSCTIMPL